MNPHVAKLQAELTGILERAFDRTTNAVNESRSGTYTGTQLYQDATDAFIDGVYGTLLPFLEFLPFDFAPQPALPTAAFEFTTAIDAIVSIPLISPDKTKPVTKVDWENLTITGTTNKIPASAIDVQIAGSDLVVKVKGASVPKATPIGTYVGNILAANLAGKPPMAQIRVKWFVI